MFFEFIICIVQQCLTIREWVILRDTNKSMKSLCKRVKDTTLKEDWYVLHKWLEKNVYNNVLYIESHITRVLPVEFPETNDRCFILFYGWKNANPKYDFDCSYNAHEQYVDALVLESIGHSFFPSNSFREQRNQVIRIGNVSLQAKIQIRPCRYENDNVTLITISKKMLRLTL